MNLEFNFERGLFNAKMSKSKIFIWLPLDQHVWGALAYSQKLFLKVVN